MKTIRNVESRTFKNKNKMVDTKWSTTSLTTNKGLEPIKQFVEVNNISNISND